MSYSLQSSIDDHHDDHDDRVCYGNNVIDCYVEKSHFVSIACQRNDFAFTIPCLVLYIQSGRTRRDSPPPVPPSPYP